MPPATRRFPAGRASCPRAGGYKAASLCLRNALFAALHWHAAISDFAGRRDSTVATTGAAASGADAANITDCSPAPSQRPRHIQRYPYNTGNFAWDEERSAAAATHLGWCAMPASKPIDEPVQDNRQNTALAAAHPTGCSRTGKNPTPHAATCLGLCLALRWQERAGGRQQAILAGRGCTLTHRHRPSKIRRWTGGRTAY